MNRKHILVISQYFYPESFRINDICQEWVKRGYRVTVVTGIPNYPEGKFFEGYGYLKRRVEKWNGINILRLPLIARGKSNFGMIANYISFIISGYFWKSFTKIQADFVFTFEVSPMTQALIGVWYSKKNKVPNYLYVQDLWPENVEIVTGIHSSIVLKPIEKLVDYIYTNCDEIFASSPSFVNAIISRGVPEKIVHYWPQYAEDFYKPLNRRKIVEIPDEDVFKIIFTGNIGYAQGLEILPKAAQILKADKSKVKFYIVGNGRYRLEFENEIKRRHVDDMFVLIDRQPAERIPEFLAACDAAFLSLKDDSMFKMTIPAKLQSYMACGMPIIAAANGETKRIIQEAKCGMCCAIGNAEELAKIIKKVSRIKKEDFQKLRDRSIKFYKNNFDKKLIMDAFECFITKNIKIERSLKVNESIAN